MFRNTILFGSARSRFLMDDTFVFQVKFPFSRDIFTTVVRTEYSEFPTGLAFNLLVPSFECGKRVAFLVEITDPRVALCCCDFLARAISHFCR